jgi:hypothetical protein
LREEGGGGAAMVVEVVVEGCGLPAAGAADPGLGAGTGTVVEPSVEVGVPVAPSAELSGAPSPAAVKPLPARADRTAHQAR